jgi:hypothetical protein
MKWSIAHKNDPFDSFWQYEMTAGDLWVRGHLDTYQPVFLGPVKYRVTSYTVWRKGNWIRDTLGWKLIEDSNAAMFHLPSYSTEEDLLEAFQTFIENRHCSPLEQLTSSLVELE